MPVALAAHRTARVMFPSNPYRMPRTSRATCRKIARHSTKGANLLMEFEFHGLRDSTGLVLLRAGKDKVVPKRLGNVDTEVRCWLKWRLQNL